MGGTLSIHRTVNASVPLAKRDAGQVRVQNSHNGSRTTDRPIASYPAHHCPFEPQWRPKAQSQSTMESYPENLNPFAEQSKAAAGGDKRVKHEAANGSKDARVESKGIGHQPRPRWCR